MGMRFDWSSKKAASDEKKHGVFFEEARTVFFEKYVKRIDDPDQSQDEYRLVLLGISSELRVMAVCDCNREPGNFIRIIFTQKASTQESKQCLWEVKYAKRIRFHQDSQKSWCSSFKKINHHSTGWRLDQLLQRHFWASWNSLSTSDQSLFAWLCCTQQKTWFELEVMILDSRQPDRSTQ